MFLGMVMNKQERGQLPEVQSIVPTEAVPGPVASASRGWPGADGGASTCWVRCAAGKLGELELGIELELPFIQYLHPTLARTTNIANSTYLHSFPYNPSSSETSHT